MKKYFRKEEERERGRDREIERDRERERERGREEINERMRENNYNTIIHKIVLSGTKSKIKTIIVKEEEKKETPIYFLKYILWIMLLQWSHFFLPFISLHPVAHFQPSFADLSSCSWFIHKSSLVSPFPILFLTSLVSFVLII